MEYNDVASKERLTGRAYFFASGDNGWIDLGNIQLMNLDYGIKRKEHFRARRGTLITDRYDAYSATPRWEITGDEIVTANLALIFLGTAASDLTQGALTGGIWNGTGRIGKWVDIIAGGQTINRMGLLPITTLTSPGSKTEGFQADYVIDRGPGKFYLPKTSSIADGAAVTVQFWCPAATFNEIAPPMSFLNRVGTMQLIEEDDNPINVPKTVHLFPVSLSTDSGGQTKVDDYKTFKMIATVTDPTNWVVLKRSA